MTQNEKVLIVDVRVFMRRVVAFVIGVAMSSPAVPLLAAGQAQAASALSGTASSSGGQTLANVTVQLRNLATGQLAGSTTSAANGAFSFVGLSAGSYAVEVVNVAGQIIGTSASITVASGIAVTGVAVSATAAAVAVGAAGVAGIAAGAAAATGVSTAVIVTTVAAAAGVLGSVAVKANASPSR